MLSFLVDFCHQTFSSFSEPGSKYFFKFQKKLFYKLDALYYNWKVKGAVMRNLIYN